MSFALFALLKMSRSAIEWHLIYHFAIKDGIVLYTVSVNKFER